MSPVVMGPHTALSLSARRAWIEIALPVLERKITRSLSARRAWIEILMGLPIAAFPQVALRKESVDRNAIDAHRLCQTNVALRKESVDRNIMIGQMCPTLWLSLSARRAWIEI